MMNITHFEPLLEWSHLTFGASELGNFGSKCVIFIIVGTNFVKQTYHRQPSSKELYKERLAHWNSIFLCVNLSRRELGIRVYAKRAIGG